MSVSSILDTNLPESALSEDKRQQILDLIEHRFNESSHAPVKKQKEELLEGDKDEDTHVLSLNMMQTYIGSYWVHFHTQLPILHRPTFNAANCPPLLLVAMMSLGANGVKPTTFLDGLKKTLSGSAVRTNSFGRTILMAGLLSVSWHMNQRDLQVSSLGASSALGGRDKWRGSLTRAFDFWKQDFDASLSKNGELTNPTAFAYSNGLVDDNVFESRTVLHHLAHMAMHVDIVDCQIYAGAPRLLGRSITPQDYAGAQRRMKESWAPTARARDATFYALRFLSQVLLPHENGSGKIRAGAPAGQGPQSAEQAAGFTYSARDDSLLNRPWVLYFAILIVWSYGYALDGPIDPVYQLDSREDMVRDMQGFLRRVGGVRAPDALVKIQDRNACLGMLILLRDMFKKTRWELLHEASNLLQRCIEMLAPGCTY
ncbi:hypothetical protein SLS58_010100 [Diplodia intermedia]|uniref:Xylanolytic transcriptional activator regulatory domain-containing protein n=1 Tax=Diplodia intermedia TaxID=856260 RepID=A0ABR3T8Q0_9PEZI